ncbi:hypothetical protein BC828DRAFT_391944 [Blastocladiella britannica]|nr:hypothetical protein BC828DRAFT_391944 [Blastocladiella britannica]
MTQEWYHEGQPHHHHRPPRLGDFTGVFDFLDAARRPLPLPPPPPSSVTAHPSLLVPYPHPSMVSQQARALQLHFMSSHQSIPTPIPPPTNRTDAAAASLTLVADAAKQRKRPPTVPPPVHVPAPVPVAPVPVAPVPQQKQKQKQRKQPVTPAAATKIAVMTTTTTRPTVTIPPPKKTPTLTTTTTTTASYALPDHPTLADLELRLAAQLGVTTTRRPDPPSLPVQPSMNGIGSLPPPPLVVAAPKKRKRAKKSPVLVTPNPPNNVDDANARDRDVLQSLMARLTASTHTPHSPLSTPTTPSATPYTPIPIPSTKKCAKVTPLGVTTPSPMMMLGIDGIPVPGVVSAKTALERKLASVLRPHLISPDDDVHSHDDGRPPTLLSLPGVPGPDPVDVAPLVSAFTAAAINSVKQPPLPPPMALRGAAVHVFVDHSNLLHGAQRAPQRTGSTVASPALARTPWSRISIDYAALTRVLDAVVADLTAVAAGVPTGVIGGGSRPMVPRFTLPVAKRVCVASVVAAGVRQDMSSHGNSANQQQLVATDDAARLYELPALHGWDVHVLQRVPGRLTSSISDRRKRRTSTTTATVSSSSSSSSSLSAASDEDVVPFSKPPTGSREQFVDELLQCKMAESLMDHHDTDHHHHHHHHHGHHHHGPSSTVVAPGIMVVCTGDGKPAEHTAGFVVHVARALRRGWSVGIVSWRTNLAGIYKRVAAHCAIVRRDEEAARRLAAGGDLGGAMPPVMGTLRVYLLDNVMQDVCGVVGSA